MKLLIINQDGGVRKRRTGEHAQVRIIFLALVSFLVGLAVGALWFSRGPLPEISAKTEVTHDLPRLAKVSLQPQPSPAADREVLDEAFEAVKRSIPNVNSTSLEQGTQILRETAVTEFQQTVQEFQIRQNKAEQEFRQGQTNQSDEQQRVATKKLQKLQTEQMEKLTQIAANSKAQIDAFQRFKGAAPH